ncbi:hypothetical protein ANN_25985 [Periplaneta americana]|uniref:THAP-type domain-containing protein n=1 Tax=Periplaneta americana TaxID=6978 RepID=A0ABQ8S533_PERAM|nr:hypothetical protein ANN_25985 [Periplaneta americana]
MPSSCVVPGCKSNYASSIKTEGYVRSFKFPKQIALREEWTRAIPRANWKPNDRCIVCIKHFRDSDLITVEKYVDKDGKQCERVLGTPILSESAVPKLFPGLPSYLSINESVKRKSPKERRKEVEKRLKTAEEDEKRRVEEENKVTSYENLLLNSSASFSPSCLDKTLSKNSTSADREGGVAKSKASAFTRDSLVSTQRRVYGEVAPDAKSVRLWFNKLLTTGSVLKQSGGARRSETEEKCAADASLWSAAPHTSEHVVVANDGGAGDETRTRVICHLSSSSPDPFSRCGDSDRTPVCGAICNEETSNFIIGNTTAVCTLLSRRKRSLAEVARIKMKRLETLDSRRGAAGGGVKLTRKASETRLAAPGEEVASSYSPCLWFRSGSTRGGSDFSNDCVHVIESEMFLKIRAAK